MRKDWKRRCCAIVTAAMLTSSLSVPASAATWKDGTYRGTGTGYKGDIVLDVEMKDGKIASIAEVEQSETASYWERAKSLFDTIIEKQSTSVDAVSGATLSSNGIKAAVQNALDTAEVTEENAIFAGGKGTKKNPYQIATSEQLCAFSKSVDAGNTYSDNYIVLTTDITMSQESFEPIGEGTTSCFAGNFDGANYQIKNLTITKSNLTADTRAGLFDTLDATATVQNVNLEDSTISLSGSSALYAGGIAGDTKAGTSDAHAVINHCSVSGTITADTTGAKLCYAGGIVGRQMTYTYVENSGSDVEVKAVSSGGNNSAYAGGISGMASNNAVIANAYALGNVTASSPKSTNFGGMAGGITAMQAGKQYNVYATGNVNVYNGGSAHKWIGALDGQLTSKVAQDWAVYGYYNSESAQKINDELQESLQVAGVPGTTLSVGICREVNAYTMDTFSKADFADMLNANILDIQKKAKSVAITDLTLHEWALDETDSIVKPTDTVFVSGVIPAEIFAGGDGSKETPYEINTEEQLRAFATSLNAKIDYTGCYIVLTSDITVSADEWTPVGGSDYAFNGHFDGKGHKVSGITIGSATADRVLTENECYIGLFGCLESGAVISNLGVTDCSIYVSKDSSIMAGAIAGITSGARIDSCYSTGTVSAKAAQGNNFAGGILGYMYQGALLNSYSDTNVSSTAVEGIGEAGGLVALNNRALITHCYTLGDTYADADRVKEGMACASALVAVEAGTMANCVAYGNVSTGSYSYYTGMLSGWVTGIGKVYQCYYNKNASMKIEEQVPNPIIDIGTAVGAGVNDEGEKYTGSFVALNEGVTLSTLNSTDFAETLNGNNKAFAADLSQWNIEDNALKKFAYIAEDASVTFSEDYATTVYAQPEVEKTVEEDPEEVWLDGTYYGRDAEKSVVVKITIADKKLTDIELMSGTVADEASLKAQILETQKSVGTSAYETAVAKALEKMLLGDSTDYSTYDSAVFAGGSGTEEKPYLIENQTQLDYLATSLNEDTSYQDVHFKLTKDVELNGQWTPIGTAMYPFRGNFDGDNHIISNLQIGSKENYANYQLAGLFGYCNGTLSGDTGTTIKNITVKDGAIYNGSQSKTYLGMITGGADFGVKIKNCHATGTIAGNSVESFCVGGGIAGQLYQGMVTNSTADVDIHAVSDNNWVYAGGLIAMTNRATVLNCMASGDVTGSALANKADLGGLLGMNGGVVVNCIATGNIESEKATNDVGGLCGRLTGIAVMEQSYYSLDAKQQNGDTVNETNKDCGTIVTGGKTEGVEGKSIAQLNTTEFTTQLNANIDGISSTIDGVKTHLATLDLVHNVRYDDSTLAKWSVKDGKLVMEKTASDVTNTPNVSSTPDASNTPESSGKPEESPSATEAPATSSNSPLPSASASSNTTNTPGGQSTNNQTTQATKVPANTTSALTKNQTKKISNVTYKVTNVSGTPKVSFEKYTGKKTAVTIPNTVVINGKSCKVTSIAKSAFKGNKKIKTITIGKNITSIGSKAFYKCSALKSIKIKSTKLAAKNVGKDAFKSLGKKITIKVPKAKLSSYKKLLRAKGFGSKVKKL